MKTNTILDTEPILYEFDKLEDKHYFAGLLNMAELNFLIALQEVAHRVGKQIENNRDEENIEAHIRLLFKKDITQSDWNYRIEILSEFLPVIKALSPNTDRAAFIQTLLLFTETLNDLRNFYTHFYHKKIEIDQTLFKLLDKLLFTTVLHVKKQRVKTDLNKTLLPKQYETDLQNKLVNHNAEYVKKYDSQRILPKNVSKTESEFDEEFKKKNKKYTRQDFINTYLNNAFHSLIFKNKEDGYDQLKDNATSRSEEGDFFSKNGFIFFLSFFLDKKNLETLFNHTKNFRGQHELRFTVTRWVFSSYVFKDVRRVLRSDYTNDALLLQMIGELNKCPKELFPLLSVEHQLEFFEDTNEYYKDNEENDETFLSSSVVHNIWRKRYDDKFPYFALRFFDEFVGFANLKFQIVLGNYVHDSRTKEFKGINISTERTVKEEIKVFGKLSEIDKLKKDYFTRKTLAGNKTEANAQEIDKHAEGWEEYPSAHYKLDNNNIPIYLDIPDIIKQTTPKKERSNRLSKKSILEQLTDSGFIDSGPIAFLSINELPALLYEILVNKKSALDVENVIIAKIREQIDEIEKFNAGSKRDKHKIPKRLLQLTARKAVAGEINFDKLLKDIDVEINRCKDKLRESDEVVKTSKKKRFNNTQRGELATWLADDIKRFAGKESRKNWKSHQHTELQALIAFYTDRKKDIRLLLEREIGVSIHENRIFRASFRADTLEDFNDEYLKERNEVLHEYKEIIKTNRTNYQVSRFKREIDKIFDFFDKRLYTTSTIETYKSKLLQKPVNLPRGIFDTDIYKPVQKGDTDNFQSWFKIASQKETYQEFYNFPRKYGPIQLSPFSDKGLLEQNKNKPVPSDVFKNEKRLREIARQDFYILEMVKYILKQIHPAVTLSNDYSLKELFQTKKEKSEMKRRAAQQSQKEIGDRSENVIDESHLLLKRFPVAVKIGNTQISDTMALKEVGKFKRLEKDKRVEILVSYNEKEEWTKKEIEDQIANYEKIRKELFFKEVHLLECKILQKARLDFEQEEHPRILQQGKYPNFKRYVAYHFFNDDKSMFKKFVSINFKERTHHDEILTSDDLMLLNAYFLVLLRNNFAHNVLPDKEVYLKMNASVKVNENKIGDYLLRVFMESVYK